MSLIEKLQVILSECRKEYELRKDLPHGHPAVGTSFVKAEIIGRGEKDFSNLLALGDNVAFMEYLIKEEQLGGKIQLIYIDPPYFSNADYSTEVKLDSSRRSRLPVKQKAYHDRWGSGEEYLYFLTYRLLLMKELLAESGSIWLHLDWHMVHYAKVIMDEIFGEKNFINEVIWTYKSGGAGKRRFARKHDTLLFYSKSRDYYFQPSKEKSYNRGYKPYHFKGVEEFQDDVGWYTMVTQKDVWQIDMVGRTSGERTGYATQKPEALVRRIVESCSREGDICADFFCGSGTLPAVAEKSGRHWIGCDLGMVALTGVQKRLHGLQSAYSLYVPDGNTGNGGKLEVNFSCELQSTGGEKIWKVQILSYDTPFSRKLPVEDRVAKQTARAVKEDPLSIIDYWSIDWNFDGKQFRPAQQFSRGKEGIELAAVWAAQDESEDRVADCDHRQVTERRSGTAAEEESASGEAGRGKKRLAALKVSDVFGGSVFKVIAF